MLWTNSEKLVLMQWFFRNNERAFQNSLKVQKFLFFYEVFSKIQGKPYSFDRMAIYKLGPFFSTAYGDYRHDFPELKDLLDGEDLADHNFVLDLPTARKANFLVSILNTDELSELTHQFSIWKKKESLFGIQRYQIPADEADFSEEDWKLAKLLLNAYPIDFIEKSTILYLDPAKFVISKEDNEKLTDEHKQALNDIAFSGEFDNPVFVNLADDGVLEID